MSSVVKGLIGGGIAVTITLLFHLFVISAGGLAWALVAVSIGSFFSGFFAEYSGKIVDETEESDKTQNYIALAFALFALGVADVLNNTVSSGLLILGGLLFGIAAYRESEGNISEYFDTQ
nr:MAG: hypothetical protein J07AB56_01270 [Candidatus Nanosalinarum sp. J07AB56]